MPMNPPPDASADPKAIRSRIDETRHRMDETIDALGQRFQGRHLVDEALNFVRKQTENGNMTQFKTQLKHSTDTAIHTVVDTVKANPIPAALVGAGIAWYFYSQTRDDSTRNGYADGDPIRGYYSDEPYNGGESDVGQFVDGEPEGLRERIREKAGELRERSQEAVHSARERLHQAGERAGELGSQVRERSGQLYRQSRERVSTAVDQHPLESGIVCLALGLIAGLALPTPPRVRSAVAPRARHLRERTQEVVDRGRQVARTAVDAAKQEAQAQGLAPKTTPAESPQV